MLAPSSPRPLALTDDQLDIVRRLAEPLQYGDRGAYLLRISELLRGHELGDGIVFRCAEQAQKEFRRSTVIEDRQLGASTPGSNTGNRWKHSVKFDRLN